MARSEEQEREEAREMAEELRSWIQSGLVEKKIWLLPASGACPVCQANADAGAIPVRDKFPSGHLTWPAHKGCRCDVSPVMD